MHYNFILWAQHEKIVEDSFLGTGLWTPLTAPKRQLRAEALFKGERNTGDVIGPIKADENITMFVQVKDKKKIVNLNPNAIIQNQKKLEELITKHVKVKKYKEYVQSVMSNMKFDLNQNIYFEFSNLMKEWYGANQGTDDGTHSNYLTSDFIINNYDQILLRLNQKDITLGEVLEWIAIHPLEFRDGYYKKMNFNHQLKFALADLIRDRELNKKSIELKLDEHVDVLVEYYIWLDNYSAIKKREEILGESHRLSEIRVDEKLNNYFISLTQKYNDDIKININALDRLELSSVDMITYNKTGPYKQVVPFFPVITDSYKLNYGNLFATENRWLKFYFYY